MALSKNGGRSWDMVALYRERGMPVWADHCPICGDFAYVLAGNDGADYLPWKRTDCKRCGVHEVNHDWHEGKGWVKTLVY